MRDLGVYPNKDNRCTRRGPLYRSEGPSKGRETDWQVFNGRTRRDAYAHDR